MISTLTWFTALSALVVVCGVFLARSADTVGHLFAAGGSMAGFLLLAGATSLPELILSTEAARLGEPDLAFGDLLGSCLFNLFILGVLDLLSRSRERMLSPKSAAHALSATITILLAAIVGGGVLLEPLAPMPAWWPQTLSMTTLLILPAYLIASRIVLIDMSLSHVVAKESVTKQSRIGRRAIAVYLAAACLLLVIGPKLAAVAIELANITGLGGTFVGTTLVAAVTSLPEVVTTYTALRIGAPDMAVGNILGSNAFNLLMLGIVDLASSGRLFADVSQAHVICAFAVIVVTAVASIGVLYRAERRIGRLEPDALAVVVLSALAFALVYFVS